MIDGGGFGDARFSRIANSTLQRRGLSLNDVIKWAWILSASSNEVIAERFLASGAETPTFILLEVLRRDIYTVGTFNRLLIRAWDIIVKPKANGSELGRATLTLLWTRLVHQARRLWPSSLVTLSHMGVQIIHLSVNNGSDRRRSLNSHNHRRACGLLNNMIARLSLPASIEPFHSMAYAWEAQKVLLSLAEEFDPPLLLNKASYSSIASVLVAQKKSEKESMMSKLQRRSWPPWRIDQDGMDAQRSYQDDVSRAVLATMQSMESGYPVDCFDLGLNILGGQEPDGTPTVHTRGILHRMLNSSGDPTLAWAARIRATRDVQEAWSAFSTFKQEGGTPSLSMYHAMFEKLEYEAKRLRQLNRRRITPGDSLNLLPPLNDNFSKYYQEVLQPPTKEELYDQMIEQSGTLGARPSGRFLKFLISHAKNPFQAVKYLKDGRINDQVIAFLVGEAPGINSKILRNHLPDNVLLGFITLLARFTPLPVSNPPDDPGLATAERAQDPSVYEGNNVRSPTRPLARTLNHAFWKPLHHSIEILRITQRPCRPAWYALFAGLCRPRVVIDKAAPGDPVRNDVLTWQVLMATLDDFHNLGLELDPQGFLLICQGLEKAIWATAQLPEEDRTKHGLDTSQYLVIVKEFENLSNIIDANEAYKIPKLSHNIRGVHLHAYVRVLGLVDDHEKIMTLLEWMIGNCNALEEISAHSRNGPLLMRRTLVAIRVFLEDTENAAKAEELVNSVDIWQGWPSEEEAQMYLQYSRQPESGVQDDVLEEILEDTPEDDVLKTLE